MSDSTPISTLNRRRGVRAVVPIKPAQPEINLIGSPPIRPHTPRRGIRVSFLPPEEVIVKSFDKGLLVNAGMSVAAEPWVPSLALRRGEEIIHDVPTADPAG
jgi:hypothetical protein